MDIVKAYVRRSVDDGTVLPFWQPGRSDPGLFPDSSLIRSVAARQDLALLAILAAFASAAVDFRVTSAIARRYAVDPDLPLTAPNAKPEVVQEVLARHVFAIGNGLQTVIFNDAAGAEQAWKEVVFAHRSVQAQLPKALPPLPAGKTPAMDKTLWDWVAGWAAYYFIDFGMAARLIPPRSAQAAYDEVRANAKILMIRGIPAKYSRLGSFLDREVARRVSQPGPHPLVKAAAGLLLKNQLEHPLFGSVSWQTLMLSRVRPSVRRVYGAKLGMRASRKAGEALVESSRKARLLPPQRVMTPQAFAYFGPPSRPM